MLASLAWRNLWRNRRRSLITLSAMIFGLFACLVAFAVGDGAHLQMIRVATSTYLGHIHVNRRGFHQQQKLAWVIPKNSVPVQLLQETVHTKPADRHKLRPWQRRVQHWSPRVFGAGLVSTGAYSSGGFLLGLDLVRESRVTQLPDSILKAMAQQALKTGQYKDRFPASYLADIRRRLKQQEKAAGSFSSPREREEAHKQWMRRALHRATQQLHSNRSVYEKTLQGLLRPREVILGKGLASVIKAQVGTAMAVVTQAYDGSMGNDRYTVVGIVESGSADMDLSLCIVPLAQLQELLVLEDKYHTLVLHLDTHDGQVIRRTAEQLAETLRSQGFVAVTTTKSLAAKSSKQRREIATVSGKPAWEVLSWQRVSPELYEFIRADEAGQYVMTLIIFFLVAFVILNTLQMSIMERTREFGVLRSLGMKGRQLVALVLWEGFLLGLVAMVGGLLLGLPVMWYLQAYGIPLGEPLQMGGIVLNLKIEGKITLQGLLFSPAVVMATTIIVSFFPAFRVARLKPTEALRHV